MEPEPVADERAVEHDPSARGRWTLGVDLGVGVGLSVPEARMGVEFGFLQEHAFGRVRLEGVEGPPKNLADWCNLTCPPEQRRFARLRHTWVLGVPVRIGQRSWIDVGVGAGLAQNVYQIIPDTAENVRNPWTTLTRSLHPGGGGEVGYRVSRQWADLGFTLSLWSFFPTLKPQLPPLGTVTIAGGTLIGVRVGVTR